MRPPFAGICLFLSLATQVFAQASAANPPATQQVVVPRLIRFSGQIKNGSGTVGVTFTLYKSQEDSAALWVETQNVTLDAAGKYTVLLGATKNEGLPVELFTSGEAQWLGIHVQGQAEMPRVLLVSVPYALKAAEAETLGGHSANDFVTSDKVTTLVKQQLQDNGGAAISDAKTPAPRQTANAAVNAGPTKFSGNTTDNIVAATQSGTGTAITAIAKGTAVYGTSTNTSGNAYGVKGQTASTSGFGVYGLNTASTGSAVGIYGQSSSNAGVALSGVETSTTGTTKGIVATVNSPNGVAAVVQNTAAGGKLFSAQGGPTHTEVLYVDGVGDLFSSGQVHADNVSTAVSGTSLDLYGVYGLSTNSAGVFGQGGAEGVSGQSVAGTGVAGSSSSTNGYGVSGYNSMGTGIFGSTDATGGTAIFGNAGTSNGSNGVIGYGATGVAGHALIDGSVGTFGEAGASSGSKGVWGDGEKGVYGSSTVSGSSGYGVFGQGPAGVGANSSVSGGNAFFGTADSGSAFSGYVTGTGGYAIDTSSSGTSGYAAWFNGNEEVFGGDLTVSGTITGGAATYQQIDHPLDPTNKYLTHVSVESSEMKNMYDGTIVTDGRGEAVVHLPEWFEELNGDFRYQLTTVGQPAQAWIATRISDHRFTIRTDKPSVEVSWQVTGVRKDAYAKAHPMQVETEKPEIERGSYLRPEDYGQPEEKSAGWARRPDAMKRWKDIRNGLVPKMDIKRPTAPTSAR